MDMSATVNVATIDDLPLFLRFIDEFCARIDADDGVNYALRLAVEEVCTNLIEYGYVGCPPGPIVDVRVAADGDGVAVTVRDTGPGVPAEASERHFRGVPASR